MSRTLRLCLSVLLSLALSAMAATAGVGHAGPMPGTTEMVICSGDATVTITVDSTGTVVDPAHCDRIDCPDCLVPTFDASVRGISVPAAPSRYGSEAALPPAAPPYARSIAKACARAPPTEA